MTTPKTNTRVWFITGTSTGLGKALVESVLRAGERVVATTRKASSLSYLDPTNNKYDPSQLLIQEMDVSEPAQVSAAFAAAVERFGRVDVVVNNAGYALVGEIEGIPLDLAKKQFDVQFWGTVNVTKEAARVFREVNPKGSGGRIFNVSSIGGYMANPTLAYYSASKFAVEGFTESFLKEMEPSWNIKGSIIEPGGFDSEWKGSSMNVTPPHPAYTGPENPCFGFRKINEAHMPVLGSPVNMAKALLKLADVPELPLRVQFGTESKFFITTQAKKTIEEAEKFAYVAHSTNKDGVDGEKYVQEILLGSGHFERNKA